MTRENLFKGVHVTIGGDFGDNKSYQQIKGWVTRGQGDCMQSLTSDTTHVVLSEEHWDSQGELGRSLLKYSFDN